MMHSASSLLRLHLVESALGDHQSIEQVYKAQKLDPTVLIHVREVVLRGREHTAPAEGKVFLSAHGAATACYIGFDVGCEDCP